MWGLHLVRRGALCFALLAVVVGGTACADTEDAGQADDPGLTSTSGEPSGGTDELTFVAVDIAWEDSPDSLPAGTTSVVLRNDGEIEHSLVLEGTDLRLVAGAGEEQSGEVDLDAGEVVYFFCDIPGHEDAGMNGELTVR